MGHNVISLDSYRANTQTYAPRTDWGSLYLDHKVIAKRVLRTWIHFTRATLCHGGVNCRPVSVCLSVCPSQAGYVMKGIDGSIWYWYGRSFRPVVHCVIRKLGLSPKIMVVYFHPELCLKLGTWNISPHYVHRRDSLIKAHCHQQSAVVIGRCSNYFDSLLMITTNRSSGVWT